jgi:hypothetical protein
MDGDPFFADLNDVPTFAAEIVQESCEGGAGKGSRRSERPYAFATTVC